MESFYGKYAFCFHINKGVYKSQCEEYYKANRRYSIWHYINFDITKEGPSMHSTDQHRCEELEIWRQSMASKATYPYYWQILGKDIVQILQINEPGKCYR